MTLTTREYAERPTDGSPVEPVMFSRTDRFSFFDAPEKHLKIETATVGELGVKLSRVTSSGHHVNLTELDHVTLLMPTHGHLDVSTGSREYRAGAGQSLAFRPNSRQTRVFRPSSHDYAALVLMVPVRAIELGQFDIGARDLAALGGDGVFLGASSGIVSSLRGYLDFVLTDLARDRPALATPAAQKAVEVLAMEQFRAYLADFREDAARIASGAACKVSEAEEFMRANYSEPLSVARVADAVGIGTRSLQVAFRQFREMTPRARLTRIRLERAHEALCRGGESGSVTEIALACGFTHLGRFSQIYHATYGERPSDTLRRSR